MSEPPLIGVPPCVDAEGRWRTGREYHYIHAAYARALQRAHALPAYLPPQADVSAMVARLDGLLIPGGGDFAPLKPCSEPIPLDLTPAAQLRFDRALLDAALRRGLPVLGICYGAQLLALERGGSLLYHLPADLSSIQGHQLDDPSGRHPLDVEAGTKLARILGRSTSVNSRHHQAIAEPGADLRVCARASDGVIEAIERPGDGFVMGVQWHPETLGDPGSAALFAAFASACRGK